MPAKATPVDQDGINSVLVLCQLMSTCTEFKADTAKLAPLLGIAQAKNVPRKINSIINPFGYELRAGRIFNKDEDDSVPSIPGTPSTKKSPNDKKASAAPSKSTSKKRKYEDSDTSDDAVDVKGGKK